MAKHGGYREPRNPAPASGPGRLSRRTDGGPAQKLMVPTGLPYGERQADLAQERTAPMSQADSIPTLNISAAGAAPAAPTPPRAPFIGPSMRPNEPITAGVDIGPGPGSEILPAQHQAQTYQQGPLAQMLGQLSARDTTGVLATLYQRARESGA